MRLGMVLLLGLQMMMTERLFHQLLFLIVYADNLVHERELFLAKNLSLMAGFRSDLPAYFNQLTEQDRYQLLEQSVTELKALPKEMQTQTVAQLCIVANADGFMDKDEWQMIYSIYHNELKLRLDDVLRVQRQLVAEMKAKQLYLAA
ncbi:MAG: TerB family tellurite resistance protein [Flammeovirgaceae bacterium]